MLVLDSCFGMFMYIAVYITLYILTFAMFCLKVKVFGSGEIGMTVEKAETSIWVLVRFSCYFVLVLASEDREELFYCNLFSGGPVSQILILTQIDMRNIVYATLRRRTYFKSLPPFSHKITGEHDKKPCWSL